MPTTIESTTKNNFLTMVIYLVMRFELLLF
jgi:hypothetical protein